MKSVPEHMHSTDETYNGKDVFIDENDSHHKNILRECDNCSDMYWATISKLENGKNKTCSKSCGAKLYRQRNKLKGSDNPNWKNAKQSTSCLECGGQFEYYPSSKKGLYCPDCMEKYGNSLFAENNLPSDMPSGKNHPTWNREEVECSWCGETKTVTQSEFERNEEFFCDEECMSDWRSENWSGEDHPLWKGGEIDDYGGKWPAIREKARQRDGYECVICSKSREDIGYGPEVHHIEPVRGYDDPQDAHRLDNVVSLCPTCHSNAEHGNISKENLRAKI